MEKNIFKVKQVVILFFIIGLMLSCSKQIHDNVTVQQLMEIKDVDFDKVDGLKQYVTLDKDEAWKWMKKELENECIVRSRLNKETGEYTCKSIPKSKVVLPAEDKILDLLDENGEFLLED
jgi:hypothetical protein